MRVAIFGGTGFVGAYLIDALVASGHEPSVLLRPGSATKLRQPEQCRTISGELSSKSAIAATVEDCGAVIYNIGILREDPGKGITFEELQYAAAVRVADAARSEGISRFLLMSANGVKSPGTRYQETKFRAEEYIRDRFDATIFRPSIIFGNPDGKLEIATQLYHDMIAPPLPAAGFFSGWHPSKSKIRMSPVHVEDVASAFVRALDDPATIGRTYELGGPEELDWTEMLRRIAQAVGRDKWILPVPLALMRMAATFLDWLPIFPVTRDQLTMLAEGNTADSAVLEALIGRQPLGFQPQNLAYLAT
jgi:NADH dehydrogenase